MSRFKWPVPSDEFFRHHIAEDDGSTVRYRMERWRFLWEEFGPSTDMLLVGGTPSMFAIHELKRSYFDGSLMATVLLAQVFIEQSLGGSYSLAGKDDVVRRGFSGLIDAARDDGKITPELADALHKLRNMRNPYMHHTIGLGQRSYMGRLVAADFPTPEDLVVQDARFAVRAVVDYLRHGSPNWNPDKVYWSEEGV